MLRAALALALLLPAAAPAAPLSVLVEEKARETYGATLPEAGEFDVMLKKGGIEEAMMISAFWMDLSTGQFLANAVTDDGEVHRVSGLAVVSVPVPVPTRRIMPDEILTEADLAIENLPMGRVGSFAITDIAALDGKQVRRMLTAGRPVMQQSVMEPLVIDRGDRVQIRFTDGTLELAAPGRALSDAHRGQEVKIVNLVSNTSLIGTAVRDGLVEVHK